MGGFKEFESMFVVPALTEKAMHSWHLYVSTTPVTYEEVEISQALAHQYEGDFYGLLADQGISTELWYPMLIINGFKSSTDYTGATVLTRISESSVPDFHAQSNKIKNMT